MNKPTDADRPIAISFADDMLHVKLHDGRMISTPLAWYPTLLNATSEQREHVTFSLSGIHWLDLDVIYRWRACCEAIAHPIPNGKKF